MEASGGEEALAVFSDDIDIVVLDVMMQGMSGYQVCLRLRERSNVPILFLTAKSQDSDLTMGFMRRLLKNMDDMQARSNLMWDSAMAENGILKVGRVTDFQEIFPQTLCSMEVGRTYSGPGDCRLWNIRFRKERHWRVYVTEEPFCLF